MKSKYLIIAILLQLVWGITPCASKTVLEVVPLPLFVALRFSISSAFLFGVMFLRHEKVSINLQTLKALVPLGILTFGVSSFCTLGGLKLGGVVNFALASSISPLFVGALGALILKEKLSRWFFVSIPIYSIGILCLSYGKGILSGVNIALASLGLVALAFFFEGFGFVFSKHLKKKMSVLPYTATLQLIGALFAWAVVVATQSTEVGNLEIRHWVSLAFVSIVSCGICFLVWYWLLNFIEANRLGFFEAFRVLSSAFFGFLLFAEPLNLFMGVGAFLLITSVWIVNTKERRSKGL